MSKEFIEVKIPILDSVDGMKVVETFNQEQLWCVCAIAKAFEKSEQENKQVKDNWNKLREWVNKQYDYYMNEKDYIGGRLCFGDMKNKMQELEEGSDE